MKEADLGQSFEDFVDRTTPDWGIRGTYPTGARRIFERFKTIFEAQWWQVNVTNPSALDNELKPISSSLIVPIKKGKNE